MMKQNKLHLKTNEDILGSLKIIKIKDGKVISVQEEKNRVVSSSGYGRNLLIRQLSGDTTYGIAITSASIGTGTATPTDGDTDLGTSVLDSISIADKSVSNDTATFQFFIPDGDLTNGSYTEFGMFIGSQLFSRALFASAYSKSTGEDTLIEYSIQLSAV